MERRYRSPKTAPAANVRAWLNVANEANAIDDALGQGESTEGLETAISRRLLLKGAGAAALAASSAGAFARYSGLGYVEPGAEKNAGIVIVGAGIAGLNAAFQLKQRGYHSELYEGSPRIGGRIFSAHNLMGKGLTTELGAEFIDSDHYEMRKLARMFDLPLLDVLQPSELKLSDMYFFAGRNRTQKEILQVFRPLARQIAKDNKSIDYTDHAHCNAAARKFDRMSIMEYLEGIGAEGWFLNLLNVAYMTENGTSCDRQSALNFIWEVGTDTKHGFAVFGDSNQRYKVKGGNHQIPQALADRLHDRVHPGMQLVAIHQTAAQAYELTFKSSGGGTKTVKAEHVILCLPFTTLREVDMRLDLPAKKRQAIQDLNYGDNAKLILGVNHRVWRDEHFNGLFFNDMSSQSGWDSSQLQPPTHGSLTIFLGDKAARDLPKRTAKERAAEYLPQADRMFPGVRRQYNGTVHWFNWPSYPWVKASYSSYTVGQATTFGGAEGAPVGNLLFAGEQCSTSQGFMESGAETGLAAAKLLVQKLRR